MRHSENLNDSWSGVGGSGDQTHHGNGEEEIPMDTSQQLRRTCRT